MGKLNAAARDALPSSEFGLPSKRGFPMPDKSHAANAKARASQAVNAGRMSASTEAKIDAKANRKLGIATSGKSEIKHGFHHMETAHHATARRDTAHRLG